MVSINYPSAERGILIGASSSKIFSLEEVTAQLLKNPEIKLVGSKSWGNMKWMEFSFDSREGTDMRHRVIYLSTDGKIQIQADLEDIALSPTAVVMSSEQIKKNIENIMTSLREVK